MIPKLQEKKKAIALRKQGFSYNEIRKRIVVAKSTLSLWLRSVGLAKRHIRRLTEKQRQTQKMAVAKWHAFRVEKTFRIKQQAQAEITSLSKRERWFIGIALYWAEGSKEKDRSTRVQFSNSDPAMILFFRSWALEFLPVLPDQLRYELYIHEKSKSIFSAIKFWSQHLDIDPAELKIRYKRHNPSPRRKNIFKSYIGLIKMVICKSIDLNRKISGWIEGLAQSLKT